MKNKKLNDLINELEKILSKLEDKNLDIEDSLELYKNGIQIVKECESKLKNFKETIKKVTDSSEEEVEWKD